MSELILKSYLEFLTLTLGVTRRPLVEITFSPLVLKIFEKSFSLESAATKKEKNKKKQRRSFGIIKLNFI